MRGVVLQQLVHGALGVVAQAEGRGPGWLEGRVTLPFEVVGAIVGVVLAAGLFYFARRAANRAPSDQAEEERKSRARARGERPLE